MAQGSFPWAGTATGDANGSVWAAPYSDDEYSDAWAKVLMSLGARGFVCPGYANNLRVTENSPVGMSVLVDTGAIYFRGRMYECTVQEALTITAADPADPRLDRIILRLSDSAQTIRLAVLDGTAAASPTLPSLTQTAATYEIPLAYVYVQAAAASISDEDIHDVREFVPGFGALNDSFGSDNLVRNSEFMAFSQLAGGATTNPPDRWSLVLTPTDIASVAKPSQMVRGRGVQITINAASEGISQTFPVKASTTYSFRILVNVTAGDVGSIVVTTNSAAPGTLTRHVRRTGAWIEEWIYYTTEADASTMTLQLLGLNNGDIISYGQVLCIEGFVPGTFRAFHEIIIFTELVTDASWDGDAKSSAQTTIDLDADYGTLILSGTQAVLLRLLCRDSGSAGGGFEYGLSVFASPIVAGNAFAFARVQYETNDAIREDGGWVSVDSSMQFVYNVTASGAGTLDAWAYICGIQT